MSSNTNTDSSSMFGEKKAREKATFCRHGSHKHSKPEKNAVYVDAAAEPLTDSALDADYLAIDQVERLGNEEQALLFSIFNRFRNSGKGYLLLGSESTPPTARYPRRPPHAYGVLPRLRSQITDRPRKKSMRSSAWRQHAKLP